MRWLVRWRDSDHFHHVDFRFDSQLIHVLFEILLHFDGIVFELSNGEQTQTAS